MRALPAAVTAAAALVLAVPTHADAPPAEVSIEFGDYRPDLLDILPGETVKWTNVSQRTHTVTSDTGLFDSGEVPGGRGFAFTFSTPGSYRYHCTIHPSIVGEVDVRRVILDTLPPTAVAVGAHVEVDGRTADPTRPVDLQLRPDGGQFTTVASVTPAADGSWKTTLTATATGDVRAVSGADASETRRLLVGRRTILVHATRQGVSVSVTPSAPYAPFLVELYLRERFGWWPAARGAMNYVSQADVRIPRPARVRIVLVDKDGWTPLATSRVVVLR